MIHGTGSSQAVANLVNLLVSPMVGGAHLTGQHTDT
jgi:hypothetical protein